MDIGNVDIAALSTMMSAQQTQAQVSTAVMKKSMDAQSEIAQTLISDFMATTITPGKVDISV